jgi:hypothetical protein
MTGKNTNPGLYRIVVFVVDTAGHFEYLRELSTKIANTKEFAVRK